MAYPVCYIKCLLREGVDPQKEFNLVNRIFTEREIYQIRDPERVLWATHDHVIVAIANQKYKVISPYNEDMGISDQIDYLKEYFYKGDLP